MKEFPDLINVKNKDNFKNIHLERIKCYIRRDLYEHIISKEEKEYFIFDIYKNKVNDDKTLLDIMSALAKELEEKGWKTKFAYGNTGLFIYSEKLPDNFVDCEVLI